MTTPAIYYPLEHWASHTGRVHVKQGPRATLLTEADITDMLKRVRRGATGIVKRNKVSFDEQQLTDLRNTYFTPEERTTPSVGDATGYMADIDEHGYNRTPGSWPIGGAL